MSPSPDVKNPGGGDELRYLLASTQALRFSLLQVERLAARIIWNTRASRRPDVVACIMQATKAYQTALIECKGGPKEPIQKPPEGPNCRPGFHEEFGICVPDEESN